MLPPGLQRFFVLVSMLIIMDLSGFGCSGGEVKGNSSGTGSPSQVFIDPEGIFQASIPEGFLKVEPPADTPTPGLYQFQKQGEQGEFLRTIRFRVDQRKDEKAADLFSPGYEASFLEDCNCSILERGVVNFNGSPSRQFIVSRDGGTTIAFHRHIIARNRFVRIVVEGKTQDRETLRKRFQDLLTGFQPIPTTRSEKGDRN